MGYNYNMAKIARVWDGSQWVTLSPATINPYPSQSGNGGKFLQTDGTIASWQTVDTLPSQTGNSGKYLTTDGSSPSWAVLDLSTKADINSPTFTGTPSAPTANSGTNTTQIATTAFVSTAISNLVNGAPGVLDTLDEIAQALNDDANFASTITTALSGKEPTITSGTTSQYWRGDKSWQTLNSSAVGLGNVENTALSTWSGSSNITTVGTISTGIWQGSVIGSSYIDSSIARLSSPALTGTPTAPTATQGTNTTQIATTEFVQKALEITQLDTFTFDGMTTRFQPKYLGTPVDIDHPLRLLLNINGIMQIVAEKPSTVWLSGLASVGYYIDDDGYIVLPEPPEPGSYFEARLFPGVDLQARPPVYPFRALDIYLGD